MRIALIPSAFSPSVGGVEELTLRLAQELVRRDHVAVWTGIPDADGRWGPDVVDGVSVVRVPMSLPAGRPASMARFALAGPQSFRTLVRLVRETRPDVLHIQCFGPNGAFASALSAATRTPLVISLQGETVMDDHDVYEHSTQLRIALRLGLRRAAVVTGCSQFTLDDAERFGLRQDQGVVVFNGVDTAEREIEPVNVPQQRFVLGLGRVVKKKGFDLLLRAFAQSHANPSIGLVIAGPGPEVGPLRDLAEDLGLADRVFLPGRVSRGRVAWLMQHAAAVVMPSRVEPFGIVALEAWFAGRPVIVTSKGGASEFVQDSVTGLVVDPHDIPALTEALDSLLCDPQFAARLGEAGRREVSNFTWEAIASKYREVYLDAIAARPRRSPRYT